VTTRDVAARPLWGGRSGSLLLLGAALASSLVIARLVVDPRGIRIAIVAAVAALIVGLAITAPRAWLFGLVTWLACLGLLRRLLAEISPPPHADPLLLVGPLVIGVLAAVAAGRGAFRERTRLANAVLVLSVLAIAGAFNPLQGGLSVGLGGLLFVLVPMLAFWIGRSLCDDRTLANVLKLVAGLGVAVSVYGLAQAFRGFPSWDAAWVQNHGYLALQVVTEGGHTVVRPFATFSAASEYALFLALALLVWLVFGLRPQWLPVTLPAAALIGTALFYQSARGVIFTVVLACGLMIGAWRRAPVVLSAVIAAAFLLVFPSVVSRLAPPTTGTGGRALLVSHQVEGLANPVEESTLFVHLTLIKDGLLSALSNPLGRGTGTVTIASEKFGGVTYGTEADLSNVAVALGILGVLVYLVIFVAGFLRTYQLATSRRDALSLLALGVLAVTVLQWLNGGNYAVAFLPWLVLGWVDRSSRDAAARTRAGR
jgi:hypothetical protein